MVLRDATIRSYVEDGCLGISPFDETDLQPASVDLHLADEFIIPFRQNKWDQVIMNKEGVMQAPHHVLRDVTQLQMYPGNFVLGSTVEHFVLPDFLTGHLMGKSSIGRLGLDIHKTAGFIDPGYEGTITLELYNAGPYNLVLLPGKRIAQIAFFELNAPAERPYGHPDVNSHYKGAHGVIESRYDS